MLERVRFLRLAVLVVAIVAVGVVVWALASGGSDSSAKKVKPELLEATQAQLVTLARQQGHEVYWVGPKANVRYEWTRTTDARLYVRYLKGATPIGSRKKAFLTVATYDLPNAADALKAQAAKSPGSRSQAARGGGFVYTNPTTAPTSAYFAAPGSDYEVEVFDPKPGKAFAIAAAGLVRRIQ